MGSRTETVTAFILVLWFTLNILGMSCYWNGPSENFVCQIIMGSFVAVTLIGGLFFILYILNKLCDSSAREREMRRQIALESPRVIMPDDEKRRD